MTTRVRLGLTTALVLLLSIPGTPALVSGVTISATATGSLTPPTAPGTQSVQNGDFFIQANALAPVTGDGIDEPNTWTFDFTGDPSFAAFPPSGPLSSARLTLTVTPGNAGITTDLVGITDAAFTGFIGPGPVVSPVIQTLPVGVTSTVQLELLGFYSSSDILGAFTANGGKIPMLYHDDVILSFARLELRVPEPATRLLLGLGLAGLGGAARTGRRRP